jgi:hypothetical protein
VLTTNAPLVSMELSAMWTRGMVTTLTIEGLPNDVHAVFVTPAAFSSGLPSIAVEPVFFGGEALVYAGLLDTAGRASYAVVVPNLPALQHVPVWCQSVAGSGLPLRASAIGGGLVR